MATDQATRLLNTVKQDKAIKDDELDTVLTNFIKQATDMVCLYVGETPLPKQLEVIVIRCTEAHYVQAMNDADGTKTYSEEGASWGFQDNEMNPFLPLLERYINNRDSNGTKGSVMSW